MRLTKWSLRRADADRRRRCLPGRHRSDRSRTLPSGAAKPTCQRSQTRRLSHEHISAVIEGTLGADWWRLLEKIHQPVLVIRAIQSYGPPGYPRILTEGEARKMVERLPNASLLEIDGNHMTMLFGDCASQIVGAIREFVGL